jgi:phosphoglucosamine mutase
MGSLFGTDGVRGKAGVAPLDRKTVRRLGGALARALRQGPAGAAAAVGAAMVGTAAAETDSTMRFLAGRDTRESGPWIEEELARGMASQGATLTSAGVIPTPAIAYLTPRFGFTAGVVISASHNPFEDNGIKVFSGAGEKFTEALEQQVEAVMDDTSWSLPDDVAGPVTQVDYRTQYIGHLTQMLPTARESGQARLRVVVDCANGATMSVAPRLFDELGVDARFIGTEPDGRNINLDCGSTAPQRLAKTVVDGKYTLGIAFDGDGDRAIFVDADGKVVDGDAVMLMCAKYMKAEGRLRGNGVVATVMSNLGLEVALREAGIDMVRCAVGDKYVMEEMLKRGLVLGGEQSGHVIFGEYLYTGDGLATALNLLRTMAATGRGLADLASELTTYPQVLLNLRVLHKLELRSVPEIAAVVASVEARLAGTGRLLVRYSGTEPLLRVMLEGQNEAEIRGWGQEIIDAARQHLGAAV